MKEKSKPRIKKNKIPFCPRKIKPIKNILYTKHFFPELK